jgi:hypothetical protein
MLEALNSERYRKFNRYGAPLAQRPAIQAAAEASADSIDAANQKGQKEGRTSAHQRSLQRAC